MAHVSVILPAFNAEKTISRAVQSILNQSLQDLELIVVDDGSTDNTAQVISDIPDPRVTLLRTQHRGVAQASNAAIQRATSRYIARMDADDFAHQTKLEKQLQALQSKKLDVVGCRVRIIGSDGQPTQTLQRYQRWINEETLTSRQIHALRFVELPVVNPTILARREYFDPGFTDNDLPEDYNLMLMAIAAGMQMGKVDDVLFDWMDGPTRLTRNDDRYSTEAFMRCRRLHLLTGPLANIETVDLWGAGQTGKPWLRWLQSQNIHVRQTFEVSHRKIGHLIHGVPVVDAHQMLPTDGTPLIVAVGADGARPLIQAHIASRGYEAGDDAWFVA